MALASSSGTHVEIRSIHGLNLIRLKGTRDERATHHGRIVASLSETERASLALAPLSKKNQTLIRNATHQYWGAGSVLKNFYEGFVLKQFLGLPAEYRDRLKPFGEASRIKKKQLWLALYQPDMLMYLASIANPSARARLVSGMPGCTTGAIQKDGESLFLRNLDYPAAGHWEKWPCVFYHEPTNPKEQKYISISSLGIHTPGLTGRNESGIIFSLHAHFSKKIQPSGVPIFFLGEDLLQNARNFEDAVRLCREFNPIGSWAINLISEKEKKGATIELSKGSITVSPMNHDDILSHSNGFTEQEFQEDELYLSGDFFEDVKNRKKGIEEALYAAHAQPTLTDAFNALGSHRDPTTNEPRVFSNTVSVVTTIQSMVFQESTASVYVSVRDETPTGLGPYLKVPYDWSAVANAEKNPELLPTTLNYSDAFTTALNAYHHAYIQWQVLSHETRDQGIRNALEHLRLATEALPTDPHLWAQRGYFEMTVNEIKTAHDCFQACLKLKLSPHHRAVAQYFLGNCLDLMEYRKDALINYTHTLSMPEADPRLAQRAERRLKRPFQRKYCQKIEPDLQFFEPLQYL